MHWFDVVALVIICLGGFRGLQKGGVSELFSTTSFVGSSLAAILWGSTVASFIAERSDIRFIGVIGFLAVFIAAYVVIMAMGGFFYGIIKRTEMHNLNRALGILAGLIRGVLIVFLLLVFLTWQSMITLEVDLAQSTTYKFLSWALIPTREFIVTRTS